MSTDPAKDKPEAPRARPRDDWRLFLMIFAFCLVYAAVGFRMGMMALSTPEEPQLARAGADAEPVRREITDRHGHLLAANLPAWSLYAHPQKLKEPLKTARDLAKIFPDMTIERLSKILTSSARFVWVKRPITPLQIQAVRDLGEPGLHFGARDMRIYPAGRAAAHLIGGVKARKEDVRFAELVGAGGVEGFFDKALRDPAYAGRSLQLSIDLGVQTALGEVLYRGMKKYHAAAASAVLMDVRSGEVLALVSLPDFDPNRQPAPYKGKPNLNPRFNRGVLGRYELGSIFKVLTAAIALDTGRAAPQTMIETAEPIKFGRYRIRDLHKMPDAMSLTDVVVRSSNIGSARLAISVGTPVFKEYLERLGLFEATAFEVSEAAGAKPLMPPKWSELSTMTVSFGHGIALSPLHLAAAYATLANDGMRVTPTLLAGPARSEERVFSTETSRRMMSVLREVVVRGTGRRADVPGYEVGGKTGTADKPREDGRGYQRDKVIASFASVFPVSDPKYVLVVSLDEATDRSGRRPVREASRTAVPVTGEAIRRIGPLLGLRPSHVALPPTIAALPTALQE